MNQKFDENPILNSPYFMPERHWSLGGDGIPTGKTNEGRRSSSYLVPIPAARRGRVQGELVSDELKENAAVNNIRALVNEWRARPPEKWNVRHASRRLLEHWRDGQTSPRLFFCQIEAAETLIWLNEVAPKTDKGAEILQNIRDANDEANPGLFRLAAKMATGAGKTTVMAMMIAYHAINKARSPNSSLFADHFLVITPGITIKDRLRVLLPQDPENYYEKHGIVPQDMIREVKRARVVIVNYQALRRRESRELTKKEREILQGHDNAFSALETEGRMLARVCPELLRAKDAIVINDEAHHCYRDKRKNDGDERGISAEEREEVKRNKEAARLWISGIEALGRKISLRSVYDLSATPFFLRGSGYQEGLLFPWVVSDFALMDAMECGIVKLPRVPIDDATITKDKLPMYRNVYAHIRGELPRQTRTAHGVLNPANLPSLLMGALNALYAKYKKVHAAWQDANLGVPPVFIVVCSNTSASKLIYDYISGYRFGEQWKPGAFDLFNNIGDSGRPLARPRTLLIDSYQLDSGEALSKEFKQAAAAEILQFKQDMRTRHPDRDMSQMTDESLLREVMNTVGKKDKLGGQIRCVVSVSMLTEGWDASNVTHILGVRAFGTQLLCEQAVGRALRRINYETDENGMLSPEYADICGVPFSFMPGVKTAAPVPPPPTARVRHLDTRALLAIEYPRIRGYKLRPPEERIVANFNENSILKITPEDAPPKTELAGIIGKQENINLDDLKMRRENEVVFFVASHAARLFADERKSADFSPSYFRDLVPITRLWLRDYLKPLGSTFMQYLLWEAMAKQAAERISRACTTENGDAHLLPVADPFAPEGSTFYVDYLTRSHRLHETHPEKSHINIAVCDSDWEMDFCRLLEDDPGVFCYARNAGLNFEVPYRHAQKDRMYRPDFIVLANDGGGKSDLLRLVVEIKGYRKGDAQAKADTMNNRWIPAVNHDGRWGRWAFVEICDIQQKAREQLAQFTKGGRMK